MASVILVAGSGKDPVTGALVRHLQAGGHPFVHLDEDDPERWRVECSAKPFVLLGSTADRRTRVVGAAFVRPSPATFGLGRDLQRRLAAVWAGSSCEVVNRPDRATSNYSKPHQLSLLARAGFDVPRSLVTNDAAEVERFFDECHGEVLYKGVSNVPTLATVLTPERRRRLSLLRHCPVLFQEYVAGGDLRAHVIGEKVFVTELQSDEEDYRRAARCRRPVEARPGQLPDEEAARCIRVTRDLGLGLSGIDFKRSPSGRLVCLELNPYPQFTFYEGHGGQPLTAAVADHLAAQRLTESDLLVGAIA